MDPYAIRAQLPEYVEGAAGRVRDVAASVYEEVIHIAGALVSRAVAERRNLILDGRFNPASRACPEGSGSLLQLSTDFEQITPKKAVAD